MFPNKPDNIDPRPKRRKDKDNPYVIFTVGIDTARPHYYVSFTDTQGVYVCMEIEKELFDFFDDAELMDVSFLNKVGRHQEHSELTEVSLNQRALTHGKSVEELVEQHMQNEKLNDAVLRLPDTQRRRLQMYFFEGMTYAQIAEKENCTHPAIIKSIKAAINKLKKYLE